MVAFASIPSIIRIAGRLHLFDEPDHRKIHGAKIPLLGGVAVFAALLFAFTLSAARFFQPDHVFIITALVLLFFFGLRDDIAPLNPWKKLSGQVVAALIVILFSDIRLNGLFGLFGIHGISYGLSILLSLLLILFIVNAYNLIDGIDGLASGLGVISSLAFALLFYLYDEMLMAILSVSLAGALMGFLPYNFYRAKIFLGDTGTMTIGFLLAVFSLYFIKICHTEHPVGLFNYTYAPVLIFSIMVVPLIDALRVFTIRIFHRRSPFKGDRNHIHHRLLETGLKPYQASLTLYIINLVFILSSWFFRAQNPTLVLFGMLLSALIVTQLPSFFLRFSHRRRIV
ncbi:MAG: MraY family glycosyltransferase [Bacteroidia bacterium]